MPSINARSCYMARSIGVEVAYAEAQKQTILQVEVELGCTIREAIDQSGILKEFPSIDLEQNQTGIFGEKKSPDTILAAGDRVEIYRPLLVSAKEARRKRAKTKDRSAGNFELK